MMNSNELKYKGFWNLPRQINTTHSHIIIHISEKWSKSKHVLFFYKPYRKIQWIHPLYKSQRISNLNQIIQCIRLINESQWISNLNKIIQISNFWKKINDHNQSHKFNHIIEMKIEPQTLFSISKMYEQYMKVWTYINSEASSLTLVKVCSLAWLDTT